MPATASAAGAPASTTAPARALATIPGSLPSLADLPPGCVFAPRCPLALAECRAAPPALLDVAPARRSACIRWEFLRTAEGQQAALHVEETPAGSGAPATTTAPTRTRLLRVEDAVKIFAEGRDRPGTPAVDGVTLTVDEVRTYGLVGESGSGKTTLARLVAGLTLPSAGRVHLGNETLQPGVASRPRTVLQRLQMVFQSPEASLNPRRTAGEALQRPLQILAGLDRQAARERAHALLEAVRLPASYFHRYPGELSGGEKQRVAIARAFAAGPDLVICDEPLSSLDVSVQGALMNLLVDLQEQEGTSYLFISHDLAAVQHLSHTIGVMYLGKIVEQGLAERVLGPPYHPYTEALVSAVPVLDPTARGGRVPLHANPRRGGVIPSGCRFHPRCPRLLGEVCMEVEPPWRLSDGRVVPAGAPGADSIAAGADHAVCCHIPLDDLAALQGRPGPAPARAHTVHHDSGGAP
jgi:peptide/nickel transport system ATP-binding protein